MVKKCIVPGCKTKQNDKIAFFSMPATVIMRRGWSKRIGVEITDDDLICAKHFQLKDIIPIKQTGFPTFRTKLRVTAVPIIEGSPYQQIKSTKAKSSSSTAVISKPIKMTTRFSTIKHESKSSDVTKPILKINQALQESLKVVSNMVNESNALTSKSSKKSKKKRNKKSSTKKIVDPLEIKHEILEADEFSSMIWHETSYTNSIDYLDSQNYFHSDETVDVKVKDKLSQLESENQQLKTKYSQLINDYVQMKTEKIQLKAELDAALAANQKLIIVKNSLVTTIQTLGKMSEGQISVNGIPGIQLDSTVAEVTDTIIGF